MSVQSKTAPAPSPAEVYDAHLVPAMFGPWVPELLSRVPVNPGDHVLDVACGTGAVSLVVAEKVGSTGSVTGLDIAPPMLDVARRNAADRGLTVNWVQADAEHLPRREGGYDVVLCQQGLQFFPDSLAALRGMHDVLRPGGRLGVAVWLPPAEQEMMPDLEKAMDRALGKQGSLSKPFSYGDGDRLERELRDAGFREITTERVTRPAHFPSADRYIEMSFRAAASVMPEFAQISPDEANVLIARIREDAAPAIARYRDGEGVTMKLTATIGTAIR